MHGRRLTCATLANDWTERVEVTCHGTSEPFSIRRDW